MTTEQIDQEESNKTYNMAALHDLVKEALSDEEVTEVCFYNFPDVYDKFTRGTERFSKIRLLIEHCKTHEQFGKLLTLVEKINPTRCCNFYRNDESLKGSEILCLLKGLDSEALIEDVQEVYELAYQQRLEYPEAAIEWCEKALRTLDEPSGRALGNPVAYARGKCCLLIASIYLNQAMDYKSAENYYLRSQGEIHSRQWSHLESLVYLGLAITQRKLKDFNNAMSACKQAQDCVDHQSIPRSIDTMALRQVIKRERMAIQRHLSPKPPEPAEPASEDLHRSLRVFDIVTGGKIVAKEATTDLNRLCYRDYRVYAAKNPRISKTQTFNLTDFSKEIAENIRTATYILEVTEQVKTDDDLQRGDLILIREDDPPESLHGKKVAVLVIDPIKKDTEEDTEIHATLKTFFKAAPDHYFLRAESTKDVSIAVSHYESSTERKKKQIKAYYDEYKTGGKIIHRIAYDIRISGEVIDVIHQEVVSTKSSSQKETQTTPTDTPEPSISLPSEFIWKIPIVSEIAAGLGQSIAENKIKGYIELEESKCKGGECFIVVVEGDSMAGDSISSGDYALIRQQPTVKQGDIAAIVIMTPQMDPVGALKRYYIVNAKREDLRHWLLASNNPLREHLVVMPSGADEKAIRNLYIKKVEAGKIITPKFYKDAEIAIAGKYIRVVRKI